MTKACTHKPGKKNGPNQTISLSRITGSTFFADNDCKQSGAIGLNRTLSDSVRLVGMCVLHNFCEQLLRAIGRNRTQSDSVGLCPTAGPLHSGQFLRMIIGGCQTQSDSVRLCPTGGHTRSARFLRRIIALCRTHRTLSDSVRLVDVRILHNFCD